MGKSDDNIIQLKSPEENDPDLLMELLRKEAKELIGTNMLLDEASVTGTANIVMAAVMAKGITT